MSVILIGPRGSGKTTVGQKLADRLWMKFVDADDLIVAVAGKTIRSIFQDEGEDRFRDLETEALRKVLAMNDHVIALGGGAVCREVNRAMIKESGFKCAYLRCEPEALLKRIRDDPLTAANRPNLTGYAGGIEEIKELLAQREPWYRQVMTVELDVTNLSPDETAVYLTRLL